MRRQVLPRLSVFALLAVGLATAFHPGCGSTSDFASGPTSLFVTVLNGPAVAVPDQVSIDVYNGDGSGLLQNITKPVAAGMVSPLGDITIYVSSPIASLRLVATGTAAGVAISAGEVTVAPMAGKQIKTTITLAASSSMTSDGGTLPSLPDATVPLTGGMGGGGAGGGPPDAGQPGGQGGMAPMLADNGTSCRMGIQCKSGFCTDSVCCDQLCGGPCETCASRNAPGMCSSKPAGAECGTPMCTQNRRTLETFVCSAQGMCRTDSQICATRRCNAQNLTCN